MAFLTVASSAGAHLCKHVTTNGVDPVPPLPYLWTYTPRRVDSALELFDLLSELRGRRDACVIRGVLKPDTEQPCRRTSADEDANLIEVPQAWVLLDFDSVDEPPGFTGLFPSHPADFAADIVERLPPEFHTASYVWRASGSAGFKDGIRLHLWFLLQVPVTGAQLKTWLRDVPLKIDTSVFRTVQPHFTADPLIDPGIADPMSARIGLVQCESDFVAVPAFEAPAPLAVLSRPDNMDPLTARALEAWNAEHAEILAEYEPGATRYECPACGSSDGLAVREDGRWNCHGGKHAQLDPPVGTATAGGVFVGTPCEFLERLPAGTLGRWLRARYPDAASFRKRMPPGETIVVQPAAPADPGSIDVRDVFKAQKKLETAKKILRGNPQQLAVVARDLGRYVPHYLSRQQIEDAAIEVCTLGKQGIPRPDIETTLATAIDAGMLDPWRPKAIGDLARNELGGVERCYANVFAIASLPDISDVLGYNEFAARVCVMRAPPWRPDDVRPFPRQIEDADYSLAVSYISDVHDYAYATPAMLAEAFATLAQGMVFNPVTDYLDSCVWDGTLDEAREFLELFWISHVQVSDTPYARAVGKRWLLSAVQRAFEPGCIQREVLVLFSESQNVGKSNTFGALCPDRNWFLEGAQIDGSRDNKALILGKWIVCIDEIDKDLRADRTGAVKNFLSTRVDTFRSAYARTEKDHPRRSIPCGTTNTGQLFVDMTGNSRVNVLETHATRERPIDLAAIAELRDTLWGAAVALYRAGEQTYLTADEAALAAAVASKHMEVSDVEQVIHELWDRGVPEKRVDQSGEAVIGFDWHADQVGNDRNWIYLTNTQLDQHVRFIGARSHRKRIAFALRSRGLHVGRLQGVTARRQYGASTHPDLIGA